MSKIFFQKCFVTIKVVTFEEQFYIVIFWDKLITSS